MGELNFIYLILNPSFLSSLQFIVYGLYFFLIGAVFLAMAVYAMTVIGWRVCWQQRYRPLVYEDDASGTEESSELNDLRSSNLSVNDDAVYANIDEDKPTMSRII